MSTMLYKDRRHTTTETKHLAGFMRLYRGVDGFSLGYHTGIVAGVALECYGNRKVTMSIENDHYQNLGGQVLYKYIRIFTTYFKYKEYN